VGILFDHPTKQVFKRDKLFTPRRASDSAIVFQIAAIPKTDESCAPVPRKPEVQP
jgi:hypothetical protein